MIAILGAGKMGEALLSGVLRAGRRPSELLVTARAPLDAAGFTAAFGIPLTRVGTIVAKGSQPVVLTRGGAQISSPMGHDHFPR